MDAEPGTAKRRLPRWARALCVLGVLALLLGTGGYVGLRLLTQRYDAAIHKDNLLGDSARHPAGDQVVGPMNFLLVGKDTRESADTDPGRSDTIIIVQVTTDRTHATLLSIPRDLQVQIPPYPKTGYGGGLDKINAAFAYGSQAGGSSADGFKLLSDTLTSLTGLTFNGGVIVDFGGFRAVVDTLGGIDLCVDVPTLSEHTGILYAAGCQKMTGTEALDYVRQRKTLPDGDYGRQRHQQQFLAAVVREIGRQGILTDPVALDRTVLAVADSLTVDLNGQSTLDLVTTLRGIGADALTGLRVPSHPEMIEGTSYVLADPPADSLWTALREGTLVDWAAANPDWVNHT